MNIEIKKLYIYYAIYTIANYFSILQYYNKYKQTCDVILYITNVNFPLLEKLEKK